MKSASETRHRPNEGMELQMDREEDQIMGTSRQSKLSVPTMLLACAVLLGAILFSGPSWAMIPDPTTERGFQPERVYPSGDLDTVNLFNGNLTVTIPIGTRYPLGGGFTYQFQAVYNSSNWDWKYKDVCTLSDQVFAGLAWGSGAGSCSLVAEPTGRSNAGAGWRVSFGELYYQDNRVRFVGSDGSEHLIGPALHSWSGSGLSSSGGAQESGYKVPSIGYTGDGSYIRFRDFGSQGAVVEMPEGTRYHFERTSAAGAPPAWRLRLIEDSFAAASHPTSWAPRIAGDGTAVPPTAGNHLAFVYCPSDSECTGSGDYWLVRDSQGREQRVNLNPAGDVASIELQAFGGQTEEWEFKYYLPFHSVNETIPPCPDDSGRTHDLRYLETITPRTAAASQPGYRYRFEYFDAPPTTGCTQGLDGRLTKLQLPTGGSYLWEYGSFHIPGSVCEPFDTGLGVPSPGFLGQYQNLQHTYGVTERQVLDQHGNVLGRTVYMANGNQVLGTVEVDPRDCAHAYLGTQLIVDRKTIVWEQIGEDSGTRVRRTDHFFSTFVEGPDEVDAQYSSEEYGLGITRRIKLPGDGGVDYGLPADQEYYLSKNIYECPVSNVGDALPTVCGERVRSEYLRYERSFSGTHPLDDKGSQYNNFRVAGSATVYWDDSFGDPLRYAVATVDRTSFDGLGHFRWSTTGGNFPGSNDPANKRDTFTDYNPTRGTFPNSFVMPAVTDRWLFDVFTESWVGEESDGTAEVRRYCPDPLTGFVDAERVLENPGVGEGPGDIFFRHEADGDGNTTLTEVWGGDSGDHAAPVGGSGAPWPWCSASPPAPPEYRIANTWSSGVVRLSDFEDGAGRTVMRRIHQDVDDTGLVWRSREDSGRATTYDYDTLGRLTKVATEGDLPSVVRHGTHDDGRLLEASATRGDAGNPAEYVREVYRYGPFGRVIEAVSELPSGTKKTSTEYYYPSGLAKKVTVSGASVSPRTTYRYDLFGREVEREILPQAVPHTGAHKVNTDYAGDRRRVIRGLFAGLADASDPNPASAVSWRSTQRHLVYDRQGRLERVFEFSDPSQPESLQVTRYAHDGADRLLAVRSSIPGAGDQVRLFTYDGRGFMTSERLPEVGVAGDGSVEYTYDSMAHPLSRTYTGGTGDFDLSYVHDAAGRPTQVLHAGTPIKELVYEPWTAANPFRGLVRHTKRRNFVESLGGAVGDTSQVVVTETLTYHPFTRRPQMLEVRSSDGPVFRSSFAYDGLGNLTRLDYPECLYPSDCADEAPGRSIRYLRERGRLSGIEELLAGGAIRPLVTGFEYDPLGTWKRIDHANGVSDLRSMDAAGRPASHSTSGLKVNGQAREWSTGAIVYDGTGNVHRVGGDWLFYDPTGRLLQARLGNGSSTITRDYSYDQFGNLLAIGSSEPAGSVRSLPVDPRTNRLIGPGMAYDEAGNLVSSELGNGQRFFYDPFNSVYYDSPPGSAPQRSMLYTAAGERFGVRDGSGGSRWSPRSLANQVLRYVESDGSAWHWDRDYVYGLDGALAAIEEDGGGERVLHYHRDHLGSTRAVSTDGGERVSLFKHLPFGEDLIAQGEKEDMRFTGHERDEVCPGCAVPERYTVDYMHARYYWPWSARFTSPDPADANPSEPMTWNRYVYASNNPLRIVDPDGELGDDFTAVFEQELTNPELNGIRFMATGGYLTADNGHPIFATSVNMGKSANDAYLAMKDGSRRYFNAEGMNPLATNCVGFALAGGDYWINPNQVDNILKGDGYQMLGVRYFAKSDNMTPHYGIPGLESRDPSAFLQEGDLAVFRNVENKVMHVARWQDGKFYGINGTQLASQAAALDWNEAAKNPLFQSNTWTENSVTVEFWRQGAAE